MKSLKQIIEEKQGNEKKRHTSKEFQDFGYRLSVELSDPKHKSLYIKLAKVTDRALLEAARRYAIDSRSDKKGAVFMWKLSQLKATHKKTNL